MSEKPSTSIHPVGNMVEISASPDDLTPRPRAIRVVVAGTIDYQNEDDTTETDSPVLAGEIIPFQPKKITAITDARIFALYG